MRITVQPNPFDKCRCVYMPLHEVAANAAVGTHRPFQIHPMSLTQRPERRHARRFGTHIRMHLTAVCRHYRQADSVM